MIELFNRKYKAVSNLFVRTIEEDNFVYPAPLSVYGTLENNDKNLNNEIEFRFSSYYDSILTLDYNFCLTLFLLTPYYIIEVISIEDIIKKEDSLDTYGYKGKFSFQDGSLTMNILETDIYDLYKKREKQYD